MSFNASSKTKASLSCLSYHLLSLSPAYRSYNPLLIGTIHRQILLVNGVDAFILLDDDEACTHGGDNRDGDQGEESCTESKKDYNRNDRENIEEPLLKKQKNSRPTTRTPSSRYYTAKHIIPMTKCEIVGIVQYIHYKANGSSVMIIDDGTGLIDCIYWDDDESNVEMHQFLRFVSDKQNDPNYAPVKVMVGDLVRIQGQMRVLSIDHGSRMVIQEVIYDDGNCDKNHDYNDTKNDDSSSTTPATPATVTATTQSSSTTTPPPATPTIRATIRTTNAPSLLSWEGFSCTREIHVHDMIKIPHYDIGQETLHWLKSIQFIKRMNQTTHIKHPRKDGKGLLGIVQEVDDDYVTSEEFCTFDANNNDGSWRTQHEHRFNHMPVLHGLDMYNAMTEKSRQSCSDMMNRTMDSNDDDDDDDDDNNNNDSSSIILNHSLLQNQPRVNKLINSYFGRQCKCHKKKKSSSLNVAGYMCELLYCHCKAKKERLDKQFKFRDALLIKLLEMESIYCEMTNKEHRNDNDNNDTQVIHHHSKDTKDTKDTNENVKYANVQTEKNATNSFQFKYNTIYENEELQSIAKEIVSQSSDPNTNIRCLYINTFQHLRSDGILYLADVETDMYVLLSKTQVLIPTITKMIIKEERDKYKTTVRLQHQCDSSGSSHSIVGNNIDSSEVWTIPSFVYKIPERKFRLLKKIVDLNRNQTDIDR